MLLPYDLCPSFPLPQYVLLFDLYSVFLQTHDIVNHSSTIIAVVLHDSFVLKTNL
jgi:hypothetical protein